jgi:hypothetical protein
MPRLEDLKHSGGVIATINGTSDMDFVHTMCRWKDPQQANCHRRDGQAESRIIAVSIRS